MSAHTWRTVEWEHSNGEVYCRIDGKIVHICDVAMGPDISEVKAKGNAIVQCWNTDIAVARAMGELDEDDSR